MIDIVTDRLENIEEKRENAGYQHFLLFLTYAFSSPQHGVLSELL